MMKTVLSLALLLGLAGAALGQSSEHNGPTAAPRGPVYTGDIIVRWRTDSTAPRIQAKPAALSAREAIRVRRKGALDARTEVFGLEQPDRARLVATLAALDADPDVEYAVAEQRRFAHAVPADPLFVEQWYLRSEQPAANRSEFAWDVSTGGGTVVAVLDTGVRFDHPDLGRVDAGGKLLQGYDFVSVPLAANDGDGRDGDPTDPGDWVTVEESQQAAFGAHCIENGRDVWSSWHGTRVASLIGAAANNAAGLAGGAWDTLVLPVRVLGKCGGTDQDIIAGMRWAAGLPTPGAPSNPTPADVINLSLGADGACSAAYRSVIAELTAAGVLVVASVGNEGGFVGSPANCDGVLGVAGLRHAGTKVGFSNLGPEVTLGAPGGNCVNVGPGQPCLFSIVVATDTGRMQPESSAYTDSLNFNVGTSFSAPLAAAAAALMKSVNSRLTPQHLFALLRETAAPFPSSSTGAPACRAPTSAGDLQPFECVCSTRTCGAGMLNAHAAVLAAQRPVAVLSAPCLFDVGAPVNISAATSFASNGRMVAGYEWSIEEASGAAARIGDSTAPTTTMAVDGAAAFTLRLTVTDSEGAQDSAILRMTTSTPVQPSAPPQPSPTAGASSGGGGALGAWLALMLGALAAGRLFRSRLRVR